MSDYKTLHIAMCVSFGDNEVQPGFSISHYHSGALLLSFHFCSLITFTFRMQNLISKHIYNNEPLDWKDCNLSVIIKSSGMSLRAPTTCLVLKGIRHRFVCLRWGQMSQKHLRVAKITFRIFDIVLQASQISSLSKGLVLAARFKGDSDPVITWSLDAILRRRIEWLSGPREVSLIQERSGIPENKGADKGANTRGDTVKLKAKGHHYPPRYLCSIKSPFNLGPIS